MGSTPTALPPDAPEITTFYCAQCGLVSAFLTRKVETMTQPPICPIDSRQLKPIEQADSDPNI